MRKVSRTLRIARARSIISGTSNFARGIPASSANNSVKIKMAPEPRKPTKRNG
jgi:hypothetical protein